jgi:CubicO group peptidase (beta-lactamase class C family)
MFRSLIFLGIQVLALVAADCPNPGPAFPNPGLTGNLPAVKQFSADLTATLSAALLRADSGTGGNATSFSIELTSATDTLWTAHHTADELAQPHTVTGDSVFRIASISKMFTVLTVLMQKNMCLEDPITKYIPELRKGGKGDTLQWDKITIRDLASQVGGLFRNCKDILPLLYMYTKKPMLIHSRSCR